MGFTIWGSGLTKHVMMPGPTLKKHGGTDEWMSSVATQGDSYMAAMTAIKAAAKPGKEMVGYKIKIRIGGKWMPGKVHKFRPADKLHYIIFDDDRAEHWADLGVDKWEPVGAQPGDKFKTQPLAPVHPPVKTPPKHFGGANQMPQPSYGDRMHAQKRFDSAAVRSKGLRHKQEQYMNNRTKATKTATKLNAWHYVLKDNGFDDCANYAAEALEQQFRKQPATVR